MRTIKEKRDIWIKPLKDYIKERENYFKEFSKPLQEADQIIRLKMVDYRETILKKQREAAEKVAKKEGIPAEEVIESNQGAAPAAERTSFVKIVDSVKIQDAIDNKKVRSIPGVEIYQVWEFKVVDSSQVPDEYKKEIVKRERSF